MLGLIHGTALGKGPPHFAEHFHRQGRFLHDPRRDCSAPLIKRSALGLVAVYNLLPPNILAATTVKQFQHDVQDMICKLAKAEYPQWKEFFFSACFLGDTSVCLSFLVAPSVF